MTQPHVDTDVLVRFFVGDDPTKRRESMALVRRIAAGDEVVRAPLTVIADAAFVLASPRLYGLPRAEVAQMLATIVRLRAFLIDQKPTVLRALQLFGSTRLDFGDAMIVASMEHHAAGVVYSYDADFDGLPGISRRKPG